MSFFVYQDKLICAVVVVKLIFNRLVCFPNTCSCAVGGCSKVEPSPCDLSCAGKATYL